MMNAERDDLTQLSLRGIAVYAARNAHRLRPLLVLPVEAPQASDHLAELDKAIADAELIASIELSQFTGLGERLRHDVAHSRLVAHIPSQPTESSIARAIARACATSEAAVKGNLQTALSNARSSLDAASVAAEQAGVSEVIQSALRTDYSRLLAGSTKRFPELGEPLDPGPLWADGAPDWWV